MLRSILQIEGQQYARVVPALFAYLFNRIDVRRFIAYVGNQKEGTRIKDVARVNGYILKNCKLYAYACHCARLAGEQMPKPKSYGVTNRDAVLLRRLNLNHVNTKKYRCFTLDEFDATVDAMIASRDIRNYIGKFVSKKMKFLMQSYGENRHDIETHLKEMAIIAVYKQYPRYESYLHFINVAKSQIHNKGQTFITSSTAKSRQKLMADENGMSQAVHVPIDACAHLEAPPSYAIEIRERLQALSKIEGLLPDRTREFLLCAAGQFHAGFSAYLKCSNDDAANSMVYEKYMNRLQTYFNVTPENTEKLFLNLRNRIYRCNNENFGRATS